MSPLLKEYLRQRVVIVTTSGECFTATLEGFDRSTNLVLADIRDRFASQDGPVLSSVQVLRGSEVVLVGLYEPAEGEEARAALLGAKAAAIHDTKNKVDNEHLIWKAVGEATRHKTTKRRKVGE
ncbi:U4/U6-U5 snRNP complex subunit [Maudiozyma humilis]|uniref:LSM2-LSM8 complex subunit LSM8 n=1 Tax=Maudiozyma humilis TaxID=51915 RepID=A0AAV5S5A9_MAUHU|nr:U4/U6-U5 snRNP complex subunit [Kazachstania humilis]